MNDLPNVKVAVDDFFAWLLVKEATHAWLCFAIRAAQSLFDTYWSAYVGHKLAA